MRDELKVCSRVCGIATEPALDQAGRSCWHPATVMQETVRRVAATLITRFPLQRLEAHMTNIADIREMKARIAVFGVGGAGGNAVNNMIAAGLRGVDFVVANTDAQALTRSKAQRIIQMGPRVTQGLGAGARPDVGRAAAEEVINTIRAY